MSSIGRYIRMFRENKKNFAYRLLGKTCGGWMPDGLYLRILYRIQTGKKLHLRHPRTFSEKLQWLKIHNRRPEYTMMVDKYAVKDYVAGIIEEEHIIPTLGVWDRPEDIDFESLPQQFVLKPTQGGGGSEVIICRDKDKLDRKAAIAKLKAGLKQDSYRYLREWPYKNVPRRVIAEKYMEVKGFATEGLTDYKFYCFNGEPKFCQVIKDRETQETIDFFDMDWKRQEFIGLNRKAVHAAVEPQRPVRYSEMQTMARKLAKGMPFSRVDLYEINAHTYFGEITFYPGSGMGEFRPEKYNDLLGQMLQLSGMGGVDS